MTKSIGEASQIELFYLIRALGDTRHTAEHLYHHGLFEYEQMHDAVEGAFIQQNLIVKELVMRFGIPALEADDKTPTKEYFEWYAKFGNFEKRLTKKQYAKLEARINAGEDTSDVIPK